MTSKPAMSDQERYLRFKVECAERALDSAEAYLAKVSEDVASAANQVQQTQRELDEARANLNKFIQ